MSVTLKLSLQMMNGVHHMLELYKIELCVKNDESFAACQAFQKSPDRN